MSAIRKKLQYFFGDSEGKSVEKNHLRFLKKLCERRYGDQRRGSCAFFLVLRGGAYPLVACLSHVIIDHASLSRRSTGPTPNRDISNIWALITLLPYYYTETVCLSHPLPVSPSVGIISLLGQRSFFFAGGALDKGSRGSKNQGGYLSCGGNGRTHTCYRNTDADYLEICQGTASRGPTRGSTGC